MKYWLPKIHFKNIKIIASGQAESYLFSGSIVLNMTIIGTRKQRFYCNRDVDHTRIFKFLQSTIKCFFSHAIY